MNKALPMNPRSMLGSKYDVTAGALLHVAT